MSTIDKPKVIAIVAPTASGKTNLAIELALQHNGEVISADSRQVYRRLNVGTEKVTASETRGVPHHLIDVVDTDDVYTAHDFVHDADAAIRNITTCGNTPIIAGGTFFYIDTLLGKITTPAVEPNEELRALMETKDVDVLYSELAAKDPGRAKEVDPFNKRRIMRALEVIDALGSVPPQHKQDCPYDVLMLGIYTERDVLRERIQTRATSAIERGLVEETQSLLKQRAFWQFWKPKNIPASRLFEIGLQYREVAAWLENEHPRPETLIKRLSEVNWQYAKRQRTWLKRDQSIEWFSLDEKEALYKRVETFLS